MPELPYIKNFRGRCSAVNVVRNWSGLHGPSRPKRSRANPTDRLVTFKRAKATLHPHPRRPHRRGGLPASFDTGESCRWKAAPNLPSVALPKDSRSCQTSTWLHITPTKMVSRACMLPFPMNKQEALVTDLGSANGTRLNNQKTTAPPPLPGQARRYRSPGKTSNSIAHPQIRGLYALFCHPPHSRGRSPSLVRSKDSRPHRLV